MRRTLAARTALLRAGYTLARDNAAQVHNMSAGTWSRTPVEIAFSPYQSLRWDGSVRQDVTYTIARMREFRAKRGAQAVLANYSLSETRPSSTGYGPMFAEQKRLGPPIAYQTATFNKIGDWRATLEFAVTQRVLGRAAPPLHRLAGGRAQDLRRPAGRERPPDRLAPARL
jgi:hypothetical protein